MGKRHKVTALEVLQQDIWRLTRKMKWVWNSDAKARIADEIEEKKELLRKMKQK